MLACIVLLSLLEGLCNGTSSQLGRKAERKCSILSPSFLTGFFVGESVDLLLECAENYKKLLSYEYHFTIARKGLLREFILSFQKSDFHHIAGLHKLRDIFDAQRGSREELFENVLNGKISQRLIEKSEFYNESEERFSLLCHLEEILDSENLIFKYNENVRVYSQIKSDYLIEGNFENIPVYLFLGSRNDEMKNQMCRTFFPKSKIDYSFGQPKYTLLRKEKIRTSDGEVVFSYKR